MKLTGTAAAIAAIMTGSVSAYEEGNQAVYPTGGQFKP